MRAPLSLSLSLSLSLAACGHATAPAAPHRAPPSDARPPSQVTTVDPDEELAKILPSHDPKYAPLPLTTSIAHSTLPAGVVPGAPALMMDRISDLNRCGAEDVIVRVDRSLPAPDRDFTRAMTVPTPTLVTLYDVRLWMLMANARAQPGLDDAKQHAASSSGQARIEAEARAILIERHYDDAFIHLRPPIVRPTGVLPAATCESLAHALSDSVHAADDDARACHDDIVAQHVGPGWWDAVCTAP
jgi:hypothetical protein